MPAAGGLKKNELYIDTPVKRAPVISGNPLEPFLRPFSPLVKVGSYVVLWSNPPLSAYTFIWFNLCILLHIAFGLTTLLTTTITLLLLTTNLVMVEYSFTRSNVTVLLLYSLVGVSDGELPRLPGSAELSQILVNGFNSLCGVFLNIRDSSTQGQAQFYFALCTTVAMLTIILTYLATTSTLLLLFWFLFCYPAIKHNQLHKKISREQIVSVFNMSMYMLYSVYQAVVQALSAHPDIQEITPGTEGQDNFEESLEMSDLATSPRSTTMTYLRGLPSAMTLRWGDRLSSWMSRKRPTEQTPSAISPTQATPSTESDSDYDIDDIEDDGVTPVKSRSLTVDTLGSNAELEFPSIERRDTLDSEGTQTLAEGLDPRQLFDDDRTFTLDSMGGSEFTLGGAQRMHLLDAVAESGDEEESDVETDGRSRGTERSPTPEFGATIHSTNMSRDDTNMSRDDTLDGRQFMLPSPPTEPKSNTSSSHHRVKQPSQQSAATTDTDFYVISDEDIRAVTDEMEDSISSNGSSTSLRERITGRIKQMSGGCQNPRI